MKTSFNLPPFLERYDDLHITRNVDKFRYGHKGRTFIYGIVCAPTDMIYIGSTWDSIRRFRQHLITGHTSNLNLQLAIKEHSLKSIQLYVFEYVNVEGLNPKDRKQIVTTVEQKYIDLVPVEKQYNKINSRTT